MYHHSFWFKTEMLKVLHLCHALVFFNRNELVVHAVYQQSGHRELGVVNLVPLGPVLPAHHGPQHERRHVEGIVLFQQLFLFGTLPSKAGPERDRAEKTGEYSAGRLNINLPLLQMFIFYIS